MIRTEFLCKSFGQLNVLKEISTEISKGQVVAIIGPSGSGKSTLLRCMNLLEVPTKGKGCYSSFKGRNAIPRQLRRSIVHQSQLQQ